MFWWGNASNKWKSQREPENEKILNIVMENIRLFVVDDSWPADTRAFLGTETFVRVMV